MLCTLPQNNLEWECFQSKVMAFKGQVPFRSKILIDNTILEQVG
jgi:hypothetical protein